MEMTAEIKDIENSQSSISTRIYVLRPQTFTWTHNEPSAINNAEHDLSLEAHPSVSQARRDINVCAVPLLDVKLSIACASIRANY